jgi:predicted RNase H-like nuclease
MAVVAGADGCRAGWLCVSREVGGGNVAVRVFRSAQELFDQDPRPVVLTIDIPIGLTESGSRDCDLRARALLGQPRGSSVFPAPVRCTVYARDYNEACLLGERADGRRLSRQAWGIAPKIREVDTIMRGNIGLQVWVREVHPEVSFCLWNRETPLRNGKKKLAGRLERRLLVEKEFGSVTMLLHQVRGVAAEDDLLDACAALWSAQRILAGEATTLPRATLLDSEGLRMEIIA